MPRVEKLRERVESKVHTVRVLAQAGVLRPMPPRKIYNVLSALLRYGPTHAGGYASSAARRPDSVAVIDELGTMTFAEINRQTNALARALNDDGIGTGDRVAVLARNHRGFLMAAIACSKLGADGLFLNTSFAAPQVAEVCASENPAAIIYDSEFAGRVQEAGEGRRRYVSFTEEGEDAPADPTLAALIASASDAPLAPPPTRGRVLLLTSGTTGTPKGAARNQPRSLDPAAALLSMLPLRSDEPTLIAAPLFHTWGFAHFTLGMALGTTCVLRRRFDPEDTLATIARERCTALIVVPVMLQRILELPDEAHARHDLSSLRVVAASGSAMPGDLAIRAMDVLGDVVYNLYGSTEVAWATVASPDDLREAPGTAGRPPRGTIVKLLDDAGNEVPHGETGSIYVHNEMLFEGYTGGASKPMVDGLMSSGDVGHWDPQGRLFIDGRDDEMIVSGGENVFPREVEDLLARHPEVAEVAVVGVQDAQFGQRLVAFAVPAPGTEPDEAGLKGYVKDNLASFKVPRRVVFLDELPRNPTGKVLKRELREPV